MSQLRLVFAAVALTLWATPALADLTWSAEVVPGEPTAQEPHPPPSIRVKVVGEPLPARETWGAFVLRHDPTDVKGRDGVRPTRAIPYHLSSEALGLVVLVEGHEYYFGNDSYKQAQTCAGSQPAGAPPCKVAKVTPGVYGAIYGGLAAIDPEDGIPTTISRAGPPGSKGALIVYSTAAETRFDGALGDLSADRLGDPRLQEGKTSRELVAGLRLAQQTLARMGTRRKALLVFSDGFDASGGGAIAAIKRQLDDADVEVFAFYPTYATDYIPDDPATLRTSRAALDKLADGKVARVDDQDELRAAITDAVLTLNSRYTLVFPGQTIDPRTRAKAGFVWDGREHPLQLLLGDEPIVNYVEPDGERPVVVLLAPRWGGAAGGGRGWLWLAIPAGLVAMGLGAAALRRTPAAPPGPAIAPAAPPAPIAAAPPNPVRTMMVNLAGGDGLPVVGWIVPIQGDRSFQTFKLQYGETRIGTTSDAHIVLGDGYMSTDHARIVMSPSGFTLIDNNSTNGTFANERRVQRHELVDNDLLMFGKTVCKFKTILGT